MSRDWKLVEQAAVKARNLLSEAERRLEHDRALHGRRTRKGAWVPSITKTERDVERLRDLVADLDLAIHTNTDPQLHLVAGDTAWAGEEGAL